VTKLTLGIIIWSVVHFVPAIAVEFRKNLIAKLGENPYKGIFTLCMVLAIYLVISGWKASVPASVYLPPLWGRHITSLLVLAGLVLFIAPYPPNNLKRILRHPQLAGVMCWGVGHLLSNGEGRSIVLFGGLAAWAFIEMLLLNRRDGERVTPDPSPVKNDIILVAAGLVVYAVLAVSHQWLFGVSPFIQ
jgi:uncharacterized membrane protein